MFGGVGERHGLSEAPQQRLAQGRSTPFALLLEVLHTQPLHVDLELVFSHVPHPQAQALVEVCASSPLSMGKMRVNIKAEP